MPDIEIVLDSELEVITDANIKKIFQDNKVSLLKDFDLSQTNNLRNMKKVIYDFSMIYRHMTVEMQNNSEYLAKFLHALYISSVEINKGLSIEEYEIRKKDIYVNHRYTSVGDQYSNHSNSHIEEAFKTDWDSLKFSDFIKKFFYNGVIDDVLLYDCYAKSKYAIHLEIPLVLCDFMRMDDCEVRNLYEQMKEEVKELKYKSANMILHAFDIMLKFSQIGLEKNSKEDIVRLAKDYLSNVEITDTSFEVNDFNKINSFLATNSSEFDEIYKFISGHVNEIKCKEIDNLAQSITNLLPNNPEQFIEKFPRNYMDTLKLVSFDAKYLAKQISYVSNSKLYSVLAPIYHNIITNHDKTPEDINWIKEFYNALTENLRFMPLLAKNTLKNLMEEFLKSIHNE